MVLMRGSRKFCQRGSNFDNVFFFIYFFFLGGRGLVYEEREDPSTTINGPSSARQRNARPTLNASLVAATFRGSGPVLLENPIFL